MTPSAFRRHPGLLISAVVLAALAVVAGSLFASRPEPEVTDVAAPEPDEDSEPEPDQEPEPEALPEPEPDPRPAEVVGVVGDVEVVDVSAHGTQLFGEQMPQDAPLEVDQAALDAFVAEVTTWLDTRLTWLQSDILDERRVVAPGSDEPLGALAATGLAGPEAWVATVEQVFGIEVDGYLLSSMRGFANAVKAFGGITVDVPTPVYDGGVPITTTGEQELTGLQALTYARDRKNRPGGDFGRSQAQAELLAIAHADVVEAGTATAVLDAVTVLRRHAETDLGGPALVRYGFEALHLPPDNVQRVLAPARIGMAGAASVVFLDDAAYALVRDAAEDARISTG